MAQCLTFVPVLGSRQSIAVIPSARHALPSPRLKFRPALRRRSVPRMSVAVVKTGDQCSDTDLEQFAERIRGEWSGYEGTFDVNTAEVQALPESYIPEQFTEWGLVPHGYETNHSMIVRGTRLFKKFYRILPAVSSFSDHVDLEEDFTIANIDSEEGMHIFPDGSFSSGPQTVCIEKKSYFDKWPAVQMYLQDPRPESRQAIHVSLKFNFETRQLVDELRVIHEKFSCIYCDGADIEGSSGYVEGWVSEDGISHEDLAGIWKVAGGSAESETVERPSGGPPATPARQLYLPKGIDISTLEGQNGGVVVQVGWLVDENTRIVLRRLFGKDGAVLLSEHAVEHRV